MTEPIPRLPEEAQVVLKRRKQNDARRVKRAKIEAEKRTVRKDPGKIQFKRAESFIASYRRRENERAGLLRRQKRASSKLAQMQKASTSKDDSNVAASVPTPTMNEGRIILVIRTSSSKVIDSLQSRALETLRLDRPRTAVFLRFDATSAAQLRMLAGHVVWGTPSARMTRELLFKRAQAIEAGKRVPLNDNRVVERALGTQNILCVEDVLLELLADRASTQFDAVSRFVAPLRVGLSPAVIKAAIIRQRRLLPDGDFSARQKLLDAVLSKLL